MHKPIPDVAEGGVLKKQSKQMAILGLVLVATALVAYALPTPTPALPHRILLPNSGGFVVFTHAAHTKYEASTCATCHHDLNIPERELSDAQKQDPSLVFACGDCHGAAANPTYKESHKQRFAARNDGGATCVACHHTESLPQSDATLSPQAVAKLEFTGCKECHAEMPGRMDAFHASCAGCHEKVKKGPPSKACQQCHM